MTWTHRIAKVTTKRGDVYFDVREYYHRAGYPDAPGHPAWSTTPPIAYGEDIDDLIQYLRWQLEAAERAKVDPSLILELDENGDKR